ACRDCFRICWMNIASNCCATSRSASVTPLLSSEGSGIPPSPMEPTLRLSRCRAPKSNTETWSEDPGRGVYCVNDIPASDDFEVGAQRAGALEILEYGQQILRSGPEGVERTHDVGQIRTGADPLQAALIGTHFDVGGRRNHR